jgi:hypothetical protein
MLAAIGATWKTSAQIGERLGRKLATRDRTTISKLIRREQVERRWGERTASTEYRQAPEAVA